MSLHLECTVCKEADLGEVASGVLECGHVYCADCIYKLWHAETAAANLRREARAHQARVHAQTRAQIQARAEEDAVDDGRKLRCPACQKCSSVDSVRRVFLSSSQAPSTAPTSSPKALTRTTSASTVSAEEAVEDLSAQLATALDHLDAAHAHAADTARAHDLNMQQLQTQLMAHAEEAHQSQVQGLAQTNAQLQRELRDAQTQLNNAVREANEMKDRYDRAVKELSQAREKARKAKARASDAMAKTRDAAMDKLADKLSANGTLGAPSRLGLGTAHQERQIPPTNAVPTSTNIRQQKDQATGRETAPSRRSSNLPPGQAPAASLKSPGIRDRAPVPAAAQLDGTSISSATRSRRNQTTTAESSRVRSTPRNETEQRPGNEEHSGSTASRQPAALSESGTSKRQTRATTSSKTKTAVAPIAGTAHASLLISNDDTSNPDNQRRRRKDALAGGGRWPLNEKIIVPACKSDKEHDFNGQGSNGTYLKYCCTICKWGCEERTPEGYVPVRKKRGGKTKANGSLSVA